MYCPAQENSGTRAIVNFDKKASGITEGENLQELKISKLLIAEKTISDSYR